MNQVLSFIALDFRTIKPYAKAIPILLALGMIVGFGTRSVLGMTCFLMLALMMLMSYPFAVGEKSRMELLYCTLGMARGAVVLGRYLLVIVLEALCAGLSVLLSAVIAKAYGHRFPVQELVISAILIFGVFSVIAAIQYPIYFKYSYNKARTYAIAPVVLIFMGIGQTPNVLKLLRIEVSWEKVLASLEANAAFMLAVPIAVGLGSLMVSYLISNRIYARRDL